MKTIIHEIGVVDKFGKIHNAKLQEGLNIITGKSSTGKSALIEIFNYCFGGSYTIPNGRITEYAEIYYLYLQIKEVYFVIGREKDNGKGFFRQEKLYDTNLILADYFGKDYFLPKDNYKKQLKKLFIDISDIDESLTAKEFRGKATPTPSVRSFMSFILQHQNLIANKHALFYRFDEKEKRDQVIEHTKIFLGFVDQQYFLLSQQKEQLQNELKKLNREQQIINKYIDENNANIENHLNLLYSIMGLNDMPVKMSDIKINAGNAKQNLEQFITNDQIIYGSDKESEYFKKLIEELNSYDYRRKQLSFKLISIQKHLQTESEVSATLSSLENLNQVQIGVSVCPFCFSEKESLNEQAENLKQAIQKLSEDLTLNHSLKSHLEVEQQKIKKEIKEIDIKAMEIKNLKKQLEQENKKVQQAKSRYEQVLMVKANLFSMLDVLIKKQSGQINEEKLTQIQSDVKNIEKQLKNYNYEQQLIKSENRINEIMAEIGQAFDFEKYYQPINLKFSLKNFDLYHEKGEEKIYLRSMGSGANWLYCHITLFLALHQYFIELEHQGFKCSIPSILFLDQPTQVYFPNFHHDNEEKFEEQKIANLEHKENIDEDIQSVTKFFTKLAQYCHDLKEKYGYSPQVIITDHADHLKLNSFEFESFVTNRWRTRGFINLSEN